jgi:membrane protein
MTEPSSTAGAGADSPLAVPRAGWIAILKRTWAETSADNVGLIAAGIAFYMFAAIVPSLGAVVLSYGLFADADTVRRNVETIFAAVPREAATIVTEQLLAVVESAKDKQGFGLIVALAIAYYGATKGASAIITGLNIAYDVEERRGFVKTTLLNLAVVLGGVVLVLTAVATTTLLAFLESLIPSAPAVVLSALRLGGYVLLAPLIVTAAAALFRFAPDRRQARWVWLSPGAILSTATWLIGTSLFGVYVSNFGDYGATYGSLSAVVVLLTWLWLTAYVFLLGAELNAEVERQVSGAAGPADASPAPAVRSLDKGDASARAPTGPTTSRGIRAAEGIVAGTGLALLRRHRPIRAGLVALVAARIWRRTEPKPAFDSLSADRHR